MVDIGNTILYSFLGVCQVYVFYIFGFITHFKKVFTNIGDKNVKKLLISIVIPVYSLCEISKIFSLENFKKYYILIVWTIICMFLKIFTIEMCNYLFDLDRKIIHINSVVNSLPAIGLALVLTTALCQNNCPLNSDPLCENILGLVMIVYTINKICLYTAGFVFAKISRNNYDSIKYRLSFIWYHFINKMSMEDITIKYLFFKYIKNEKHALAIFDFFRENNKLLVKNNEFKYFIAADVNNLNNSYFNQSGVVVDKNDKNENINTNYLMEIKDKNLINQVMKDENFELKINSIEADNDVEINKTSKEKITTERKNDKKSETNSKEKANIIEVKTETNRALISEYKPNITKIAFEILKDSKKYKIDTNYTMCIQNLLAYYEEAFSLIKKYLDLKTEISLLEKYKDHQNQNQSQDQDKVQNNNKESESKKLENDIIKYTLNKDFSSGYILTLNENLSDQTLISMILQKLLSAEKQKILELIENSNSVIPQFFIVDSVDVGRNELKIINEIWSEYSLYLNSKNVCLNEFKDSSSFIKKMISHLINPPIIASIIGLFFGFSGLRRILFSKNHYIVNIFSSLKSFYKCYVPLISIVLSDNIISVRKPGFNSTMKKSQLFLSFFYWIIVSPLIGIAIVYIVKNISPDVRESKVLMFCIFMPYGLIIDSVTSTLLFMVDNFYMKEYLYLFKSQIISFFFVQTLILVIYFIIFP